MVGLHRAGAVHHVEAERADLRHVGGHDLVAALRHHRDVGAAPVRRHAKPEEADAERLGDLAHLRQMREQLAGGLMHGFDRRARQLELPARFERDRAAAGHVGEPDDVVALHDRLPAEQVLHAVEQRPDAARPAVGHRRMAVHREGELLVLGADAESSPSACSPPQTTRPVRRAFDRRHVDLVASHAGFRQKKVATLIMGRRKGQRGRCLGCNAKGERWVRVSAASGISARTRRPAPWAERSAHRAGPPGGAGNRPRRQA